MVLVKAWVNEYIASYLQLGPTAEVLWYETENFKVSSWFWTVQNHYDHFSPVTMSRLRYFRLCHWSWYVVCTEQNHGALSSSQNLEVILSSALLQWHVFHPWVRCMLAIQTAWEKLALVGSISDSQLKRFEEWWPHAILSPTLHHVSVASLFSETQCKYQSNGHY